MAGENKLRQSSSQFDRARTIDGLRLNKPIYDKLRSEALYILTDAIEKAGIKIDAVESRTKDVESTLRKCEAQNIEYSEVRDLVGLRVITLFKSSLPRLEQLIAECFFVDTVDDKIAASAESFGYMSTHLVCRMKDTYAGPRYDDIKQLSFEIQLRTICMHAWAAVSHYLDYKSERDIPFELRKELNALSGLFYVADSQFESAYKGRMTARETASQQASTDAILEKPLNLDTLTAYLAARYEGRWADNSSDLSDLLEELEGDQLITVGQLASMLDEVETLALAYETAYPPFIAGDEEDEGPDDGKFTRVGVVRISQRIWSADWRSISEDEDPQMAKFLAEVHRRPRPRRRPG